MSRTPIVSPAAATRRAFHRSMLAALSLGLPASRRVAGQEATSAATPGSAGLERAIRGAMGDAGGAFVAVAVADLKTGDVASIRGGEPVHAASTMKLPIMMEVFRRAEAGELSLDDRVPIKNEFASIVDGSKYALDPVDDSETDLYKQVGRERTLRELVGLMITVSSNLATNLVIERAPADRVTELMRSMGAGGIRVLRGVEDKKAFARGLNNEVTADGLATILRRIAERKAVSARASEEMLGVLRGQKFNEAIPAGLPKGAGIAVAHKTGSIKGLYHDAAVVEPPGRPPYVLVVLTRGIDDGPRAHPFVAGISRAVYAEVVGR